MTHDVFGFVDGENLLLRYEAMLKAGAVPKPDVIHLPGLLVWHPEMTRMFRCDFTRISFYQTIVGDQESIDTARSKVANIQYDYRSQVSSGGNGSLYPRLFKKQKNGTKTKSVDINISVDVLRTSMTRSGNVIFIVSGDGDYLPLVEEVNRHGLQVWLAAFSSGLSRDLRFASDEFFDLDRVFFEQSTPA